MKIGVIGIGKMGEGIARNLLGAGHEVVVYNRTRSKAEALESSGARVASSLTAVCEADAVLSVLADDKAVEDVVFGSGGLPLGSDAVHVSSSTISVALSEELARVHAERGELYVAAPVFGRPEMAAQGKLFVVAGGEARALERCKELFDTMGQETFVLGDSASAANLVKLSGNFLIASAIESMSEAVALTRKAGIDPALYLKILTSTLFSGPVYKAYGNLIAEERYEPPGFKLPLGLKDVRLVLAAGDAYGAPLPVASLLRDRLLVGMRRGYHDKDWAALGLLAAEDAGLD